MMGTHENKRLAVLIDADNAQASVIQELLAEVSRYGTATIKRAYGDWTTSNLKGWKDTLHRMAIQPIQQFSYTTGKNSTDSSLIIDAMDVLHAGSVDGFCLVSSDSDFTRLATRVRESGLVVYGFGEHKTPVSFVAACDKFIFTEILRPSLEVAPAAAPAPAAEAGSELALSVKPLSITPAAAPSAAQAFQGTAGTAASSAAPTAIELQKLKSMVLKALEATSRDDGWASLSALGSQLSRSSSSFDPRNYQVPKLGDLMRKQPYLEIKEVKLGEGPTQQTHHYVRKKP